MIRVHLINEGEPINTLEYEERLDLLETTLRGRQAKVVIVDGLLRKDCPDSLFNVMRACLTSYGYTGVVVFLNDLDARRMRYNNE